MGIWIFSSQFAKMKVMKRRLLISVLCLSLASLAPAPLAACAMLMAPESNCAPGAKAPAAKAEHCEGMSASEDASQDSIRAGASKRACCEWNATPATDANAGSGKVNVPAVALAIQSGPEATSIGMMEKGFAPSEQELFNSPPDRQSLLSVFLI